MAKKNVPDIDTLRRLIFSGQKKKQEIESM